jgi:hypothetical protein
LRGQDSDVTWRFSFPYVHEPGYSHPILLLRQSLNRTWVTTSQDLYGQRASLTFQHEGGSSVKETSTGKWGLCFECMYHTLYRYQVLLIGAGLWRQ